MKLIWLKTNLMINFLKQKSHNDNIKNLSRRNRLWVRGCVQKTLYHHQSSACRADVVLANPSYLHHYECVRHSKCCDFHWERLAVSPLYAQGRGGTDDPLADFKVLVGQRCNVSVYWFEPALKLWWCTCRFTFCVCGASAPQQQHQLLSYKSKKKK